MVFEGRDLKPIFARMAWGALPRERQSIDRTRGLLIRGRF
jgi:hypothetical protein